MQISIPCSIQNFTFKINTILHVICMLQEITFYVVFKNSHCKFYNESIPLEGWSIFMLVHKSTNPSEHCYITINAPSDLEIVQI